MKEYEIYVPVTIAMIINAEDREDAKAIAEDIVRDACHEKDLEETIDYNEIEVNYLGWDEYEADEYSPIEYERVGEH